MPQMQMLHEILRLPRKCCHFSVWVGDERTRHRSFDLSGIQNNEQKPLPLLFLIHLLLCVLPPSPPLPILILILEWMDVEEVQYPYLVGPREEVHNINFTIGTFL